MIGHTLRRKRRSMSGYIGGYLGGYFDGYCDELVTSFFQDPVMPSQEPPSDAKSEEVDLPPDDTEDTDGSKTPLFLCCFW